MLCCVFGRAHRGKGLAAFLKAIGYLIPLMDNESANYYTREVMVILIREFQSPDEEMKKIVLKVWRREGERERESESATNAIFCSGGEAVLHDWWCWAPLHQGGDLASLLQALLESEDGSGQKKLQTGQEIILTLLLVRGRHSTMFVRFPAACGYYRWDC